MALVRDYLPPRGNGTPSTRDQRGNRSARRETASPRSPTMSPPPSSALNPVPATTESVQLMMQQLQVSLHADVLSIRSVIEQEFREHSRNLHKELQEQYASLAQEFKVLNQKLLQQTQAHEIQVPTVEKVELHPVQSTNVTQSPKSEKTLSSPISEATSRSSPDRESSSAEANIRTGKNIGTRGKLGVLPPRARPTRPAPKQQAKLAPEKENTARFESPIRLGPTTWMRGVESEAEAGLRSSAEAVMNSSALNSPEQATRTPEKVAALPAALLAALLNGNVEESLEVLAQDDLVEGDLRGLQGYTALRLAVEHGYTDVSSALMGRMASSESGIAEWIQIAKDLGHSDVIDLLKRGTNFGEENRDFWCYTALRLATERGNVDVRDALLRFASCSPTCKTNWLRTAEDFGHQQVVDLLRGL